MKTHTLLQNFTWTLQIKCESEVKKAYLTYRAVASINEPVRPLWKLKMWRKSRGGCGRGPGVWGSAGSSSMGVWGGAPGANAF